MNFHSHGMVGKNKQGGSSYYTVIKSAGNSFSQTPATHCGSSVPLARVAFAYLALPCLACAAVLPPGKGSIPYITKKSSPSIS